MSSTPGHDEHPDQQPRAKEPAVGEPPDPSSPPALDPEDWASTAPSGDDERYQRDRPPHWE